MDPAVALPASGIAVQAAPTEQLQQFIAPVPGVSAAPTQPLANAPAYDPYHASYLSAASLQPALGRAMPQMLQQGAQYAPEHTANMRALAHRFGQMESPTKPTHRTQVGFVLVQTLKVACNEISISVLVLALRAACDYH